MTSSFRELAHAYGARGYVPVLMNAEDKRPLHKWRDLHSYDQDLIEQISERAVRALVAIRTDPLLVIDCDLDEAGAPVGEVALADMGVDLSRGLRVRTPSGGLHAYFSNVDRTIKCSTSQLAPHVDVRANGGLIIVPGSVRADGRQYEALTETLLAVNAPEPERRLVNMIYAKTAAGRREGRAGAVRIPANVKNGRCGAYAFRALHSAARNVARAAAGTRNETLNRETFSLYRLAGSGLLSEGQIEQTMTAAALMAGLGQIEIANTLKSARKGLLSPRFVTEGSSR